MKTIWKYEFPLEDTKQTIAIKGDWKILKIKLNEDSTVLYMWAEVDTESPEYNRLFEFFGTGQEVPKTQYYIDTFFIGGFVFHLYEIRD